MAPRPIPPGAFALPLTIGESGAIASPFQFLTTGEDNLRLTVFNSASGARVAMQGLRFTPEGTLKSFAETLVPTSDRLASTLTFLLGPGALSSLTVFAAAGTPLHGQTFIVVQLVRGFTGATVVLGTLLSGYITERQALGWPGSPIDNSLDAPGAVRFIVGTNPAAGSPVIETVPTGARWELLNVSSFLTTDATVASREPYITIDNGAGAVYASCVQPAFITASSGRRFSWSGNLVQPVNPSSVGSPFSSTGLPIPGFMLAGHRFILNATNFQAGDDWTAPNYTVREWMEAQ